MLGVRLARAAVLLAAVVAAASAPAGRAHAGGLGLDLFGARSIGRAGTQAVSGDGGAALVANPAGLARRTSLRVQLAASLHDDDASYRAPDAAAMNSPTIVDRSSPETAPSVSVCSGLGPLVVGAALLETGRLGRVLPAPEPGQPDDDVQRLFPHRYGGLSLDYRRRDLVVGAAARVGDWLGLGLSVGAADVELGERRRVWAGFAGRDVIAYPSRDLDLRLEARDRLVPEAHAGALIAPPELPLEMGLSVSWSADAWAHGSVALDRTGDRTYPAPELGGSGPIDAQVRLGAPTTVRGGLRYLGERVVVEVEADLSWYRQADKLPVWRTRGVSVVDDSGQTAAIDRVPSLVALRNHTVVRSAVNVEVVSGLLWLTAGYAYATAATSPGRLSPGFGDLGGHTLAIGAEGTWNRDHLHRRLRPDPVARPHRGPGRQRRRHRQPVQRRLRQRRRGPLRRRPRRGGPGARGRLGLTVVGRGLTRRPRAAGTPPRRSAAGTRSTAAARAMLEPPA